MTDDPMPRRERPDGSAWLEAQRTLAERNDEVSKTARRTRDVEERALAARQIERERGRVYR